MPNMYWVVFMLFCYFGIVQNTARHVNITIENHCRIFLNNNLIFGKRTQGRPIHLSIWAWMFLLKSQVHSFLTRISFVASFILPSLPFLLAMMTS